MRTPCEANRSRRASYNRASQRLVLRTAIGSGKTCRCPATASTLRNEARPPLEPDFRASCAQALRPSRPTATDTESRRQASSKLRWSTSRNKFHSVSISTEEFCKQPFKASIRSQSPQAWATVWRQVSTGTSAGLTHRNHNHQRNMIANSNTQTSRPTKLSLHVPTTLLCSCSFWAITREPDHPDHGIGECRRTTEGPARASGKATKETRTKIPKSQPVKAVLAAATPFFLCFLEVLTSKCPCLRFVYPPGLRLDLVVCGLPSPWLKAALFGGNCHPDVLCATRLVGIFGRMRLQVEQLDWSMCAGHPVKC